MIDWVTHRRGPEGKILVMEVDGRLDVASSQYLLDCINGHMEEGVNHFILDCSPLDFISSAGLGTLVRANKRIRQEGGHLAVAGVKGIIAEAIHIAHMDKIFHLFSTVDEAEAFISEEQ